MQWRSYRNFPVGDTGGGGACYFIWGHKFSLSILFHIKHDFVGCLGGTLPPGPYIATPLGQGT